MAEVQQVQQQPQQPVQPELPHMFCVKTHMGGREGYFLMRWSVGNVVNNEVVHILKPTPHHGRFYNIEFIPIAEQNINWFRISTRKNAGNIVRPITWRFTSEKLKYEEMTIPVLRISPMNALPSIKATSFIPIVTNAPAAPAVTAVTAEPVVPEIPEGPPKYPIETIPQHIVRAVLRDAVMHEEICPITNMELDVSNGAITSCFHLFNRDAICKWLSMPGSRDKCPVCNTPCNSYTLD
jgi:hypothetical protein